MIWGALVLYVFLVGWFLWYSGHTTISMIYAYIRYVELFLLYAASSFFEEVPVLSGPYNMINEICDPQSLVGACKRNFYTMQWVEIKNSSLWINLFCLGILIYYCVKWMRKINAEHPGLNYKKTHNIASFTKESIALYPHLKLFSQLNLIDKELDDPLFGMSQTSRQFAFAHRLINGWKKESDGTYTPSIDRDKALLIFKEQLGKHWTKSTDLSPSETILVACAMPRLAATDSSLSDEAYKEAMADSSNLIAWCWDQFKKDPRASADDTAWLHPTIPLEKPRAIIQKYIGSTVVQKLIEKHAYNRTILFAFYMQARRLGVLPPAEFRWLRFFDREIWYVLQNIGRPGGYSEGGAPLCHYLYESKQASAIAEPQLDKAINALETQVCGFRYGLADKQKYEEMEKALKNPKN